MKTIKKLLLIMASVTLISSTAFAADRHSSRLGYSSGHSGPSSHQNHRYGNHYYAPKQAYGYGYRSGRHSSGYYGGFSHYRGGYSNAYPRHSYRYGTDYTDRACQKVSKIVTENGYSHRVGGTMCYDRYGESYIVPGSRYSMH